MSQLRGSRWSLPVKLAALGAVTQLATVGLLLWLSDATAGSSVLVRAGAFALALSPPIFMILFVGRYIITRVTLPLVSAYTRLAAGDFEAKLPPLTAGADFLAVRAAFAAMTEALARSTQVLKDADLERRRLFADLAHELATPTSTLLGIAHALRTGDGDAAHLLSLLEHECARLDRLIADVREVAHIDDPALPMQLEPCDVGELATRAVERARVNGRAKLRCDVGPAPARVDPQRIDQVLVNLIDNATRHANGGTVAVSVAHEGDGVRVRVEDSGAGVPDEMLPQLGRRLLRVDPSRSRDTGGHGLGLSIVRAIVARHGGSIAFSRADLGGLAVEIRLPDDHNNTATTGPRDS